ncbi:MAG: translocation/assembly module TamB domain-containing protein [Acidobacteria bacterium]|nr:translocation/assembly module TamB domain-containing protein [Acidobacteriota bacterium]
MPIKNIIRWSLVLALALLVVGVVIIYILQTRPFHNYVLSKIIQKTQEATGGRVEIADYDFHWLSLRADVHRMAIHGTEEDADTPLFSADRVGIGLKLISALRGKIDLSDVQIHRPIIHLLVDKDGNTNIPQPEIPEKDRKPVDLFDLAVKQFRVEGGELYYNDRRVPFSAELRDVQTEITFDILRESYDGTLTYQEGRVQFTDFNPVAHKLEAAFSAARSGLKLDRLLVSTGLSEVLLQATVTDYKNPTAEGTFQGTISTDELRSIFKQASLPIGQVTTNGSLRYRMTGDDSPFLEGLFIEGQMNSPLLALRLPQARSELRRVRSHYRLENGNLVVDDLETNLLGGTLTGTLTMRHLAEENSESELRATLHSISLEAVRSALTEKPLRGVSLKGTVAGTMEASWRGPMLDFILQSDLAIKASTTPVASHGAGRPIPIPVNGAAHLKYDGARKTLSLQESYLRTPHTRVRVHGIASERSSIRIMAESNDLQELDLLALSFRASSGDRTRSARATPELLGLQGTARLNAQIQGPTENLHFSGELIANDLHLRQESVRLLRTRFEISPSAVALRDGYLEMPASGRIRFGFSAELRNWDYSASQPLAIQASTSEFPADELINLLGLQYPINGALTADISIRGSQLRPNGKASIQLVDATLWKQPVQKLSVILQGNGDALYATVSMEMQAGNASGKIAYLPQSDKYELEIVAKDVQLEELEALRARNLGIAGVLNLTGSGTGTLQAPQIELNARIPEFKVRDQTMTDVNLVANVANQRANLSLVSQLVGGDLKASADVALTRDYDTTATVDALNMPLGLLLANYLPRTGDMLSQTEIHASLKGPLKDFARVQAHVEIPKLTMRHEALRIENVSPIRLDYRNEVLALQRVEMKGTGTELELQGTTDFRPGGNLNGSATGTLDLRLVQLLRPEMRTSGQVELDVRARGTRSRPDIQGQIRIIDAAFQSPDAPLGAEKLNGELSLRNNRILINQLSGRSGGGTLSASGSMILGSRAQFNLGFSANGVRLRYPYGVRTVLNTRLALTGDVESALLSGQVLVDRVSFTRDFDLAVFLDQFRGSPSPPPSEGFAQQMKLDIRVVATEGLGLESAKLSVQGSGNLSVRGTAAQPVILGRANLTGGELFFLVHRYEIQNGVINFTNPLRTEPVVNLSVRTVVNQYDLNLTFVGPVDNLRTAYTSDPPLPPVDIINLLAFGQITTARESGVSTSPALGAQSILAKGIGSQVSGQIERLAGLSHLSIDPTIGGGQQNPGARLAIQQRVTSKLLFTFATDLTSTQGERIQLDYQVNRGWSVSAVRDENGGYALDVKKRKTF